MITFLRSFELNQSINKPDRYKLLGFLYFIPSDMLLPIQLIFHRKMHDSSLDILYLDPNLTNLGSTTTFLNAGKRTDILVFFSWLMALSSLTKDETASSLVLPLLDKFATVDIYRIDTKFLLKP